MVSLRLLSFVATCITAAAWHEGTSSADLRRAFKKRPHKESHVSAETPDEVFKSMNRHLSASGAKTKPCEVLDHDTLNNLLQQLDAGRDPALHTIYKNKKDKRALHYDDMDYKLLLWAEEKASL